MYEFKTAIEAIHYSKKNPTETVECKTSRTQGNPWYHLFYVNGKKHGEYTSHWNNGEVLRHFFYVNGKRHGEYKEYCENGQLNIHCFFVNDEEFNYDQLKDGSYKSLCIKKTLFDGNVIDEDI